MTTASSTMKKGPQHAALVVKAFCVSAILLESTLSLSFSAVGNPPSSCQLSPSANNAFGYVRPRGRCRQRSSCVHRSSNSLLLDPRRSLGRRHVDDSCCDDDDTFRLFARPLRTKTRIAEPSPAAVANSRIAVARKKAAAAADKKKKEGSSSSSSSSKFKNFDDMVSKIHQPLLVDFHTKNCGPCQLLKKELKHVRETLGDRVQVVVIDTDRFPSLGTRFQITGLPTLLLLDREGLPVHRMEGVGSAEEIIRQFSEYL